MMKYFWVRIYDYKKSDELEFYTKESVWEKYKGILLDEYYLCGEEMTREQAKEQVKSKSSVDKFAKPRKNDGIYAIVMDSTKYWYERFTVEVDDFCFNIGCGNKVQGKLKHFPYITSDNGERRYFCCYSCCSDYYHKTNPNNEGDWQSREDYTINGGVYGYIYHIYNRKTNMHYIGQTVYMPFFRWQEHAKSGLKGDITDLVFETITEVRVKSQEYLNNVEAWWIRKFIDDYGKDNVMNLVVPRLTISDFENEYSKMIKGQIKIEV